MPHQPSKLKLTTTIRQVSPLHGRCRSAPMDQKYLPLQSDHVLNRKGTHKITWISRFHAAPWAVLLVQWEDPALQKMWDHWHSADRVQHHFRLWTSPADSQSRRFILNYLNNLVLWQESGYQMGLLFSSRAKKYRKKSLKLPSPATLGSTAITDAGGTRRKALRRGDGAETASRGGHSVSSNGNWGTSWDATTSAWHGANGGVSLKHWNWNDESDRKQDV